MNKSQIFYHMYCINDCLKRFENTYTKIKNSSLLEKIENLNVILVGPEANKNKEHLKHYHKVETFVKPVVGSEAETLCKLWEHCQTNDSNVLYLHSKGVTRPDNKNVQNWSDLMEYFLIEKHEQCLESLNSHDVCGLNYHHNNPHFSGNFWWSTSDHIKKLKKIKPETTDRLYCEFWLFDVKSKIKEKVIYDSGVDHYGKSYPREIYAVENK
jgi:hypothetical protein